MIEANIEKFLQKEIAEQQARYLLLGNETSTNELMEKLIQDLSNNKDMIDSEGLMYFPDRFLLKEKE